jgi:hypothetical protein
MGLRSIQTAENAEIARPWLPDRDFDLVLRGNLQ